VYYIGKWTVVKNKEGKGEREAASRGEEGVDAASKQQTNKNNRHEDTGRKRGCKRAVWLCALYGFCCPPGGWM
jgi:hypothetical protein